jgi:hypothetical protein
MRAKIDVQMGSWPAWWWLPPNGRTSWPDGGEIDMMEFYRGNCLFNVMDAKKNWTVITVAVTPQWAKNYHVWTMDWDSTKIDLSLDGELINHYKVSDADGTNEDGSNPFRAPGYMILNQAMGGSQGGDITNMTFPVDFRVDWVRVHTMSSGTSHTLTVNDGTGSGVYRDGTKASITVKLPLSKDTFVVWTVQPAGVVIEGIDKATAVITMPSSNVTATPTFYDTKPVVSVRPVSVSRALPVRNSPVEVFDIRGRRVGNASTIAASHQLAGKVYFYRNSDGTVSKSVRINSRDIR